MSDFGADTSDFHSDFASDFRTEGSDYASDFASDFGGEPRTAKQPPEATEAAPPEATEAAPPEQGTATGGHRGIRAAAIWQRTAQEASHGAWENATAQGHKQRLQGKRGGGGIGIAPNIKTPYRRVKTANKAHSRKAHGIHREQKKTPHSVSHAGHGYFWSFARSSSSRTGCNRIYNRIKGGTSSRGNCSTYAGAGQAKVNRRVVVVLV